MSDAEEFAETKKESNEACPLHSPSSTQKIKIDPDQIADCFKTEIFEEPLFYERGSESADEFESSCLQPVGPMLETPSTAGPSFVSPDLSSACGENHATCSTNLVNPDSDPLSGPETGNDGQPSSDNNVFQAIKSFQANKDLKSSKVFRAIDDLKKAKKVQVNKYMKYVAMNESVETHQEVNINQDVQQDKPASKDMSLTLNFNCPITSPVDVLTPIDISYSTEGVPPPLLVKCEEGEERDIKNNIKSFNCKHINDEEELVLKSQDEEEEEEEEGEEQEQEGGEEEDTQSSSETRESYMETRRKMLGDCGVPSVAELLESQQLQFEVEPLKVPLRFNALIEAQPSSSRPKLLSPGHDDACNKLRTAYSKRLEAARSKPAPEMSIHKGCLRHEMVAQQLEKIRRHKQNQNWRDFWLQDLEKERIKNIRLKTKEISTGKPKIAIESQDECIDVEEVKSDEIGKMGQNRKDENSEIESDREDFLLNDDKHESVLQFDEIKNTTCEINSQNEAVNPSKDMSVEKNERKQDGEIMEMTEIHDKKERLKSGRDLSRKRKRTEESLLARYIENYAKVSETSTSAALMADLIGSSSQINDQYNTSQGNRSSQNRVINQDKPPQKHYASNNRVISQDKPSQEHYASTNQVISQYKPPQEHIASKYQVINQYKPSQEHHAFKNREIDQYRQSQQHYASKKPGTISNRTGVRPNVIVVGKNIAKSSSFENEVLDLVKEAQELKLRREAKLAKWFADTELSGIPVTFDMLRNMAKGWAPHLKSDKSLHDFLTRFQLKFRTPIYQQLQFPVV